MNIQKLCSHCQCGYNVWSYFCKYFPRCKSRLGGSFDKSVEGKLNPPTTCMGNNLLQGSKHEVNPNESNTVTNGHLRNFQSTLIGCYFFSRERFKRSRARLYRLTAD